MDPRYGGGGLPRPAGASGLSSGTSSRAIRGADLGAVVSRDGLPIAVFPIRPAEDDAAERDAHPRPPLLMIHGTASDHTTWRVAGPLLAARRHVYAIDRRGRGESGDVAAYTIEREYEDVAAVAETIGNGLSPGVDVLGHSYGGRVALGAALLTPVIRRIVAYEGAPVHVRRGRIAHASLSRLEADVTAGRPDRMLDRFLRAEVGFTTDGLAAYHANPVWPDRVAAAERTLLRELRDETTPAAGLERMAKVGQPVLLVLGSLSPTWFRRGTERLAGRLANVTVVEIAGAAHAAHHTHAREFVRIVSAFLDSPDR